MLLVKGDRLEETSDLILIEALKQSGFKELKTEKQPKQEVEPVGDYVVKKPAKKKKVTKKGV